MLQTLLALLEAKAVITKKEAEKLEETLKSAVQPSQLAHARELIAQILKK